MRTRLTILAVLVLSVVAAPVAFADDPPVITVPTPTAPAPDPRPVSKPKPKPKPRPSVHPPAARPARPVARTYTPRPASVAPTKPRISRPPHKKPAVVKQHKPKPATKKPATTQPVTTQPATTQPSSEQPGVVGAEQTPATTPVASPDTGSDAGWSRTALLLVVASILGTIVVLRRRRGRPRQLDVEVIEHQAERAVHFPLGKFNAPPVTQQALSARREEPVVPMAPAPAEQHSELGLHPRPAGRTQ